MDRLQPFSTGLINAICWNEEGVFVGDQARATSAFIVCVHW
ncbi:hypothetical protein [Caedibacter taeniospiralis]